MLLCIGDKTNQGIRELNASSIGMAKSALQALNDVGDLLGDGSKGSIIHVLPDEIQQCSAVLSNVSLEVSSGLCNVQWSSTQKYICLSHSCCMQVFVRESRECNQERNLMASKIFY